MTKLELGHEVMKPKLLYPRAPGHGAAEREFGGVLEAAAGGPSVSRRRARLSAGGLRRDPGSEDILRLLAQPWEQDDADDAERREWLGEFAPAQFALASVNRDLRRIKC